MWICKKCNEEVEDNFDCCWNCEELRENKDESEYRSKRTALEEEGQYLLRYRSPDDLELSGKIAELLGVSFEDFVNEKKRHLALIKLIVMPKLIAENSGSRINGKIRFEWEALKSFYRAKGKTYAKHKDLKAKELNSQDLSICLAVTLDCLWDFREVLDRKESNYNPRGEVKLNDELIEGLRLYCLSKLDENELDMRFGHFVQETID